MGLCKFCNKWIKQPEGRRKKEFCNNTCRSNFWYGKNKKGKIGVVVDAPQKQYDAPKLPDNFIHDEPLSFEKLKQQIVPNPSIQYKTAPQYMKWKREIENEGEYQQFLTDLENNPTLTKKEKTIIKTQNPSEL